MSELREWDGDHPGLGAERQAARRAGRRAARAHAESDHALYPPETLTDEDVVERIAELMREAALEGVSDELPHSLAVTVDDMVERDDKDLVEVYANLCVERDSQKGIIIGKGGSRLREVGATRARADRAARRHARSTSRCT